MSGAVEFALYFLAICAVVALVCSLVRAPSWHHAWRESTHFFVLITLGVLVFSVVVHVLQNVFVR